PDVHEFHGMGAGGLAAVGAQGDGAMGIQVGPGDANGMQFAADDLSLLRSGGRNGARDILARSAASSDASGHMAPGLWASLYCDDHSTGHSCCADGTDARFCLRIYRTEHYVCCAGSLEGGVVGTQALDG